MAKVEVNDAQELLKLQVPVGRWRWVADDEVPAAVEALRAVVGKAESKLPSWTRRLAIRTDGSQFLIVLDDCHRPVPSSIIAFDDSDTYATTSIPVALPIAEAVALLNSDASPELELARRRAKAKTREDARVERNRKEIEASRAERDRLEREAQTRVQFRADTWPKLSPLQQILARLALMAEKRDPDLASDIRACVDADASDFPRGQWWTGLAKTMEGIRVTDVLESIPSETRFALKMQHGNNPAKIVKAWEFLRAQKSRAA